MSKRINYIITDNNITVNYDGQTHIVSRKDALAERLITAVREQRMEEIPDLVSAARRVEVFGRGNFVVRDGEILVNGQVAPRVLGEKIVKFSDEGLPYQPLVRFAEKILQNPSFRAVNELFEFLEKNDHPLTDDGNFIAYKRVRGNFKDIHSGTFDNSVGTTVEMPRNQVDEDSQQTCSNGLHVANWNYAHTQFASNDPLTDIMLEVEVNPADVVSIPVDYNQSKMRVCKYKVLGVIDQEHSSDVQLRRTESDSFHNSCAHDECCEAEDEEEEEETCMSCGGDTDLGFDLCQSCEEEEDESDSDYPFDRETY
jgi:hypothetical protein